MKFRGGEHFDVKRRISFELLRCGIIAEMLIALGSLTVQHERHSVEALDIRIDVTSLIIGSVRWSSFGY